MTDPVRFADDPRQGPEREVLEAGRQLTAPDGAREQVLAGVMARLQGPGGGGEPGAGSATPGPSAAQAPAAHPASVLGWKVLGGAAVVGLGVAAVVFLRQPPDAVVALEPPVSVTALQTGEPPPPVPIDTSTADPPATAQPVLAPSASVRSAPASKGNTSPSSTAAVSAPPTIDSAAPVASTPTVLSELEAERKAIAEARQLLQSGQGALALGRLEEARSRFPRGVLGQEREVLTIEALAATGQRAAATARARAFLAAFPKSPHAARLEPFVRESGAPP